jgi:hypothetical protein
MIDKVAAIAAVGTIAADKRGGGSEKIGEKRGSLGRRVVFLTKKGDYREKNEKISARTLERGRGRWYNGNRRIAVSVAKRRF